SFSIRSPSLVKDTSSFARDARSRFRIGGNGGRSPSFRSAFSRSAALGRWVYELARVTGATTFLSATKWKKVRLVSMLPGCVFLRLAGTAAGAEFLSVEVFMRDMNCQSCSETLGGSFKRLKGVEKVDVSMEKGSVRLDLAKSNRVSVEQVWDAIKRVGF